VLQELSDEQPPKVPASLPEATKLHQHIGRQVRKIVSLNVKLGKRIAALRKKTDKQVGALKVELLALAKGIHMFATEHRAELLERGRKSVKLPHGGTIEWETIRQSLYYEMKEEDAVALLEKAGLGDCVDYNPTVNKTKVKNKLKDKPELLKKLKGFRLEDGEIFRLTFAGQKQRVQGDAKEGKLEIVTPRENKAVEPVA
jgi:phage host-nuclease inhibitor protein Gam